MLALAVVPVISVAVRKFGQFLRELSHKTQAAAAVAASIAEVCDCDRNNIEFLDKKNSMFNNSIPVANHFYGIAAKRREKSYMQVQCFVGIFWCYSYSEIFCTGRL